MDEIIEELIPVKDYDSLIKRIRQSQRLNALLFVTVLFVSFFAFIAISLHTYKYEKRLHQYVKEFRQDVLELTGDQNIAVDDLNRIVLDRNWITFQRLSLEQLQDFCNLRDRESLKSIVVGADKKSGTGGQ